MSAPPAPGTAVPEARKSLGQHFLSDPAILARIVGVAGVQPGDAVLEIGPGPGGLTRALLAAGARVWAVEADPRMVAHLEAEALEGLEIWQGDALALDYPALAERVGGPLRLVANLPYNISGPLLARLLRQRSAFRSLTLMLQREVAERLAARPGTRARGRLSVLAQTFCTVTVPLKIAPGSFRPPPKVESRVVDLRPRPPSPLRLTDEATLWEIVRLGFQQRRKMLRNALAGVGPALAAGFAAAGLDGRERAEALSTEQWILLANAVAAEGGRQEA